MARRIGAPRCQSVARSAGGSGCRRVLTRNCSTRQIARIREIQGLGRVSGDLAGSLWLAGVARRGATWVGIVSGARSDFADLLSGRDRRGECRGRGPSRPHGDRADRRPGAGRRRRVCTGGALRSGRRRVHEGRLAGDRSLQTCDDRSRRRGRSAPRSGSPRRAPSAASPLERLDHTANPAHRKDSSRSPKGCCFTSNRSACVEYSLAARPYR